MQDPSTYTRATLRQRTFNLFHNWWSYRGVVWCPPHPPYQPPLYIRQFLVKFHALLHRVALLYVDGFSVILGQVLELSVNWFRSLHFIYKHYLGQSKTQGVN